jgi:hypothetical protein
MATVRDDDDPFLAQDLKLDETDINDLGIPETLNQDVIDELVNSPAMPAEDRLGRLINIRGHLARRSASEFGDDDAASLLKEVDRAIGELRTELESRADEPEGYERLDPALDVDPMEHRETLSPDDDDLLDMERSEEDEEDEDDLDNDDDDDDDEDDDEDEIKARQFRAGAEEDLDEVLDPKEWDDGDGFDSGKGVH